MKPLGDEAGGKLTLALKAFVEGYFEAAKAPFGPRRKSGARKLRACDEADLFTIRALRRRANPGREQA